MRSNAFDALDHIGQLNVLKKQTIESSKPFSRNELKKKFQECGLPTNPNFWVEFQKVLLIRVGIGSFVWRDKNPIYYKVLEIIYANYKGKRDIYVKRYKEKHHVQPLKKREIVSAINLLKSYGFEIYAPNKGDLYKKL